MATNAYLDAATAMYALSPLHARAVAADYRMVRIAKAMCNAIQIFAVVGFVRPYVGMVALRATVTLKMKPVAV
ncbi:MAG: hypothetical protein FWE52_01155 [Alphaproteobacteria bacterium]|nr:hypothetical protein [Alphaproteobacteria bacterium]